MLLDAPNASAHPYAHHRHGLALQKYLLLQEQQETLRQHLDELRSPRQSSSVACASATPSPSTSPTRMSCSSDTPRRQAQSFSLPERRARPYSLANGGGGSAEPEKVSPNDAVLAEVAVEEAKLCDVNEGMKRALTELLNCEMVRGDRAFRTWVQCRLMDTERELRSGRRRRSAPGP